MVDSPVVGKRFSFVNTGRTGEMLMDALSLRTDTRFE